MLQDLISVRRDIAKAAGWQSYAHHKLARTALSSTELVRGFLEHVSQFKSFQTVVCRLPT